MRHLEGSGCLLLAGSAILDNGTVSVNVTGIAKHLTIEVPSSYSFAVAQIHEHQRSEPGTGDDFLAGASRSQIGFGQNAAPVRQNPSRCGG